MLGVVSHISGALLMITGDVLCMNPSLLNSLYDTRKRIEMMLSAFVDCVHEHIVEMRNPCKILRLRCS